MTEEQFVRQVVELAHLYGWLASHISKSARKVGDRWVSSVIGDRGEPDLRLVRPPHYIAVELKMGKRDRTGGAGGGTYGLTPEQKTWQAALERCPGVSYYAWTPADLERIAEILR